VVAKWLAVILIAEQQEVRELTIFGLPRRAAPIELDIVYGNDYSSRRSCICGEGRRIELVYS
jgi:hypothetical protein